MAENRDDEPKGVEPYEPPCVIAEEVFETLTLACAKTLALACDETGGTLSLS
jgi:hypothetical protein